MERTGVRVKVMERCEQYFWNGKKESGDVEGG